MSSNVILGSLREKYAALKCEFALGSRTKVEMSSLLQESMDTFDGGILSRIQMILHDLKVLAGTFGYPIFLELRVLPSSM